MPRDRLRALNIPAPITVELDSTGLPRKVVEREVEEIREVWRIDDEWWRSPIVRRYYEVVMEGGGRMILFEDLVTGEWFGQKP